MKLVRKIRKRFSQLKTHLLVSALGIRISNSESKLIDFANRASVMKTASRPILEAFFSSAAERSSELNSKELETKVWRSPRPSLTSALMANERSSCELIPIPWRNRRGKNDGDKVTSFGFGIMLKVSPLELNFINSPWKIYI